MKGWKTKAFKGKNGKHYIRLFLKQLSLASKINSKVAASPGQTGTHWARALAERSVVVHSGLCVRLWFQKVSVAVCRADAHEFFSFVNSLLCAFPYSPLCSNSFDKHLGFLQTPIQLAL